MGRKLVMKNYFEYFTEVRYNSDRSKIGDVMFVAYLKTGHTLEHFHVDGIVQDFIHILRRSIRG
jgi:hypothetical protein